MSSSWVRPYLLRRYNYHVDAVAESLCDREEIITANIRSVKLSSPDVRLLQVIQELN